MSPLFPLDFSTFLERRLRLDRESALAALAEWLNQYERDEARQISYGQSGPTQVRVSKRIPRRTKKAAGTE